MLLISFLPPSYVSFFPFPSPSLPFLSPPFSILFNSLPPSSFLLPFLLSDCCVSMLFGYEPLMLLELSCGWLGLLFTVCLFIFLLFFVVVVVIFVSLVVVVLRNVFFSSIISHFSLCIYKMLVSDSWGQ